MFDSAHQTCPLVKLLGNTAAREREGGGRLGQQSLALSEDGRRLACIGPLSCNITVLDALSLSEVSSNSDVAVLKLFSKALILYVLNTCDEYTSVL